MVIKLQMVIKLTFTCLIGNFKVNSQFLLIVCIVCVCTISDKTDKSLQTYSNLHSDIFFRDTVWLKFIYITLKTV